MKVFASLVVVFASFGAMATQNVDPFEARSCRGFLMSGARALDLLGPATSVNLAEKDTDQTSAYARVFYRFRNKINGNAGRWYAQQVDAMAAKPMLSNKDGQLTFDFLVYPVVGSSSRETVACDADGGITPRVRCAVTAATRIDGWGSGTFDGIITDDCLRLISKVSTSSRDEEWVYFLQFP